MLTLFRQQGLLKAKGRQRTDSTHVLAAIHVLNRLECVGETLRQALNRLAAAAPEWLQSWVPAIWFDRYSRPFEEYRLPAEKPARYALAAQIGADGRQLLLAVYAPTAPAWLRELPAVQILRRVWLQQFAATNDDQPMQWRTAEQLPPAPLLISTPYDPDARYGKKRNTEWTGYKVHLTETCDDDTPVMGMLLLLVVHHAPQQSISLLAPARRPRQWAAGLLCAWIARDQEHAERSNREQSQRHDSPLSAMLQICPE